MIKTRKFRGDLGALYGGIFRFMCVCVCVGTEVNLVWFDLYGFMKEQDFDMLVVFSILGI